MSDFEEISRFFYICTVEGGLQGFDPLPKTVSDTIAIAKTPNFVNFSTFFPLL
jgi:hypothetical protein